MLSATRRRVARFTRWYQRQSLGVVVGRAVTATPLALGFGQRFAEAVQQTPEEAARHLRRIDRVLVRHLAVQLVPIGPDRDEEYLHAWAVR